MKAPTASRRRIQAMPPSGSVVLAALSALALIPIPLQADPPAIDAFFPTGAPKDGETGVQAVGRLEPWPLVVHTGDPFLTFIPDAKEKGRFIVRIADEALPGPRLIRAVNADGASAPRLFIVGDGTHEILESEPNGDLASPQRVDTRDTALVVNGRLESGGDIDCFAVDLRRDQLLVADVLAYGIDSPVDPILHLRDASGFQLAFNHDATTTGLDPRLEFRAPENGRYTVQLSGFAHPPQANVRFTGGNAVVYRLTLRHDSPASALAPPFEGEPNDSADQAAASPLSPDFRISGTIDPPGDVDRFAFTAAKDRPLRLEVSAARLGFLTDPVLHVEDSAGAELARHDDIDANALRDAAIDWTAPEDGSYFAVIRDVNGKGGPAYGYRLEVSEAVPEFDATAAGHTWTVQAGSSTEIKLAITRKQGHQGEVVARAEGLPAGVALRSVPAPAESGEWALVLEADSDAAPGGQQFTLWVSPPDQPALAQSVFAPLTGATTDAGDLLINRTAAFWITVVPAPAPPAPEAAAAEVDPDESAPEN